MYFGRAFGWLTAGLFLALVYVGCERKNSLDAPSPPRDVVGGVSPVITDAARWSGWRFDLNKGRSPTAPEYIGVAGNTLYRDSGPALNFGWDSPVGEFERSGPSDLLLDGHFEMAPHTLHADVPAPGDYQVKVSMGDNDHLHDHMRVSAEGQVMLDDITTADGQFIERTFRVRLLDSTLDLEFRDVGEGNQDWVVNAIEVYSVGAALILTPPTAKVPADGKTIDRITGTAASRDSLITVMTDCGLIVSADASSSGAGIQVLADSNGNFEIAVRRPEIPCLAHVTASELAGAKFGETMIVYTAPAVPAERPPSPAAPSP